jgi:hypothetical protein
MILGSDLVLCKNLTGLISLCSLSLPTRDTLRAIDPAPINPVFKEPNPVTCSAGAVLWTPLQVEDNSLAMETDLAGMQDKRIANIRGTADS